MIHVSIYRNDANEIYKLRVKGHAGYRRNGTDIVCSAVSILVSNTINCILEFTSEPIGVDIDETGMMCFWSDSIKSQKQTKDIESVKLLIKTLEFGLCDIRKNYTKHIKIHEEV